MEFVDDSYEQNYSYSIDESTTLTMVIHEECSIPLAQGTILVLLNIALAIIGTFGNILIILAVLNTPRLRQKPSNFLLLSLAVADLLVTIIAQPLFSASMAFKAFGRQCVREVDLIYVLAAPLAASSSVFHLAAISIDRALSALTPHRHRDIISKCLKPMLLFCWIMAAGLVCILVLYPKATSSCTYGFFQSTTRQSHGKTSFRNCCNHHCTVCCLLDSSDCISSVTFHH